MISVVLLLLDYSRRRAPEPGEDVQMVTGLGAFMKSVEVRSEEGRETSLHAEGEAERRGFDRAMVTSVISERQCRNKKFPISGTLIYERRQVLSNCFVTHLSLAVTLRVVASRRGVVNVQSLEEVLRHLVGELLPLVSNKFQWQTMTADPAIQNGSRVRQRLFIWQYNKFHIFRKCISDA